MSVPRRNTRNRTVPLPISLVFQELEDGLVPAPLEITETKFLRDDGVWAPASGDGDVSVSGTGFLHNTAGVLDSAAKLVVNADVAIGAAIVESKLALSFATHSNANDPSAGEKAALAGSSGTPGGGNRYITAADPKLSPFTASQDGLVDAPGTATGKYLKDNGTWDTPTGGSGDVVGPGSATDNAVARFDLTTGKLIQNSVLIVGDTGNITGAGTLNTHTIPGGTGTLALTSNIPAAYTDEMAQDAVGGMVASSSSVALAYVDATPSLTATVVANGITNAMLAQVATQTFKGRTTGSTGNVEDLTATQATAMLNAFVGDSGSGGTKGSVPAPASGDAAGNKFLSADGTWDIPAGTGGSGDRTVFIYQPGGSNDPTNGLYVDFDDAYAEAVAVVAKNLYATIVIDDSLTSPAVIPDDTYDLQNITLVGATGFYPESTAPSFLPTEVETGDTVFENWSSGASYISLTHTGSAPLAEIPLTSIVYTIRTGNRSFYSTTTSSIWFMEDDTIGQRVLIILADPGTNFIDGGYEIIEVEDPNSVLIQTAGEFNLAAAVFRGDGEVNIHRGAINGDFNLTQTNLSGDFSVSNFDPDYTPSDTDDWDSVPASMSEALNELASVVSAIGSATGDVDGPGSATDNAIARFDSTTGKLIQNSTVLVGDTGNITGLGTLNTHTLPGGTGTIALLTDITGSYTDEQAQDAIGAMVANSSSIALAYVDATPSLTASVITNGITNAMLAQIATATFKGRTTGSTGNVEDLTTTQATALLNAMVGDSGSGGTKGLVPAPGAGDAAGNKFLSASGSWGVPAGSGDVAGPGSATDNAVARFDATTGKLIQNSVVILGDTGNLTGLGTLNGNTIPTGPGTLALLTDIPAAGLTLGKVLALASALP